MSCAKINEPAPTQKNPRVRMLRRYGLKIGLALLVIATAVYAARAGLQPQPQLPFTVRWADARHALIEPITGMTRAGLLVGDRFDLATQSRATRIALLGSEIVNFPTSFRYPAVIERG